MWRNPPGPGSNGERDFHGEKRSNETHAATTDPDAYRGGALELQPDSQVTAAPRAQGTAVLFPSFVLHRVTPITEGTRWSLTLWAHGPAFR